MSSYNVHGTTVGPGEWERVPFSMLVHVEPSQLRMNTLCSRIPGIAIMQQGNPGQALFTELSFSFLICEKVFIVTHI